MTDLNHTPLSADMKPAPPAKQPQTVRYSPESAPTTINESISTENKDPAEKMPLEEAKEHEVNDDQVKQYVEENKENIELPPELKSMGLKAVTQTNFPSYQNVKLPLTDEKVLLGEKAPMNTSIRWLAEFAKFLLWRAHITLKTVHGRVVRVVNKKKSSFK